MHVAISIIIPHIRPAAHGYVVVLVVSDFIRK